MKTYAYHRASNRYRWVWLLLSFLSEVGVQHKMPVLVYQMARVGSTSVQFSLQLHGIRPVYHLHVLAPERLHLIYPRTMSTTRLQSLFLDLQRKTMIIGTALHRHIVRKRRPVKIITPIREPIARNVSLFFHFMEATALPYERLGLDELRACFLKGVRHATALTWFDVEFLPSLGLDVYAYSFPKGAGYMTLRVGNIDLLLLKAELDDAVKAQVIANFLELSDFRLVQRNAARRTGYSKLYQKFVQQVHLPPSYIEAICRSRYMCHFYAEEEIEQARARWSQVTG